MKSTITTMMFVLVALLQQGQALAQVPLGDFTDTVTTPVKLLWFDVKTYDNQAVLLWQTTQEFNASHFEVQHSTDGVKWGILGYIPCTGEYYIESSYDFRHTMQKGDNYYRLKQVDIDGAFELFDIKHARYEVEANYTVYPNPTKDMLNIETEESIQTVRIYSNTGKLIIETNAAKMDSGLDVSKLPKGIYHAELDFGHTRKVLSFSKQ